MPVFHNFTVNKPDGGDTSIVRPSNWNSAHAVTIDLVSEVSGVLQPVNGGLPTAFSGTNISGTLNSNGLSLSVNPPGAGGGINLAAGTQTATSGTIQFANSNGVTFGMSNSSQITASVRTDYAGTGFSGTNASATLNSNGLALSVAAGGGAAFSGGVSTGGNTLGSTGTVSNQIVFAGGNNITLSQSTGAGGATVTISGPNTVAQSTQPVALSGSNGSFAFSTATFGNSNGLSFYTTNGSMVGSYTVPSQTVQTQNVVVPGAGTQTATSGTVVFANSNGISFGMSGSSQVTASYTVPSQTNQSIGLYAVSNTTNNSSTTLDARTLSFQGVEGATVGFSNGSIQVRAPVSAGPFSVGMSNLGNTSGTNGVVTGQSFRLVFAGGNNITLSQSLVGSSASITISAFNQSNQSIGIYGVSNTTGDSSSSTVDARSLSFRGAGIASVGLTNGSVVISVPSGGGAGDGGNVLAAGTQTANTTGTVAFSNSNGITFGMSNSSVVTASHNGITQQSTQPVAISGSNGSFAFSTLTAGNLNGLSFYTSNGSLVGSYTVPTQSTQPVAVSGSNGSFAFSTATFGNLNGLSFYTSNGSMVGSYTVPAVTNSSMTVSDSATSGTLARLAFTNLNGVTLSLSTGAGGSHTIVGSHNALTSQSNQAFSASGGSSAFQTLNFANSNGLTFSNSNGSVIASYTVPTQSAQTIGLYGVSNTTGQSSSSTVDARSFSMQGAGAASVGLSNGSWIISAPNAAAGNVTFSAGTTSNGLADVVFSNSNGVSFGLNGSTITASVDAGGVTANSRFVNEPSITQVGTVMGNSLVSVVPFFLYNNLDMSNLRIGQSISAATAVNTSLGFLHLSASAVLYTLNGSTLSSINSGSASYSYTHTSNNTSSINGARGITLDFNSTTRLPPGEYWMAIHMSTTNSGTGAASTNLGKSISMLVGASAGSAALGLDPIGQATDATRGASIGLGMISTGATIASIAVSDITQTGTRAMAAKLWLDLRNYSVW